MPLYLKRLLLVVLACASVQNAPGQLYLYMEQPGTSGETTDITGATTATFSNSQTGYNTPAVYTTAFTTPIGTVNASTSAPIAVVTADQYGAAGGTGNYLALGNQSNSYTPVTITLNHSENYLGLWWSAADSNNVLALYNGSTLVDTITTAQVLALLSGTTVRAVNGTVYNSSSYFGNPNSAFLGQNNSQPYYYLDIVVQGATFNSIEIENNGSTGFETDNWSVASGITTSLVPTSDVLVVPEPSQYAKLFGGIIFCLVAGQRLLKKLRANSLVTG